MAFTCPCDDCFSYNLQFPECSDFCEKYAIWAAYDSSMSRYSDFLDNSDINSSVEFII